MASTSALKRLLKELKAIEAESNVQNVESDVQDIARRSSFANSAKGEGPGKFFECGTAAEISRSAASGFSQIIVNLAPISDENLFMWTATLLGPKLSPYEGGRFILELHLPESYPLNPPKVKFLTPVCHPNIHWETGEICLDLLKSEWSPAWTLKSVCIAIGLLLSTPEPDSPLNCDVANLMRCGDLRGYNSLIRMYTLLHSKH